MTRGQNLIIAIFGFSLMAAGFSLWWRYLQTRPVLDFWGPTVARLITHPEKVEALRLERLPADKTDTGESRILELDSTRFRIVDSRDVTRAPGFINARHALVVRRSFQWDRAPDDCLPDWEYALRFSDSENTATVVFDFECKVARQVTRDETIGIDPIAEGLQTVLDEQLTEVKATSESSERGTSARKD